MTWRISEFGWQILPGVLASLGFALLLKLGALQPLEQVAYTSLFHLRGQQEWDDRVVVIAIDDDSIKQLGRFPWSRQRYVELLNNLEAANPSLIAFNLLWSEASPHDAQLAQAMTRNGRVVLAEGWDSTGLPLMAVPTLQSAAIASGHVLKQQDFDGITRKVDLQVQGEPALGVAIVKSYSLVQENIPLPDLNQSLWLNWVGKTSHIQQYAFVDVINSKIPPQKLQHKIVLVGVTATGIDSLPTPFNQNPPASGVFLQATLVSNLLRQNWLQLPAPKWMWIILLLGGPGFSWLLYQQKESRQFLIWLGVCLGWGVLVFILFSHAYWLPIVLPLCLLTTTAGGVFVGERLRMGTLLRQRLRQIWEMYRQDLVNRSPQANNLDWQTPSGSLVQGVKELALLAEQLGRSQSTQAAIARSLSTGLVATDWDGLIWFCNPIAMDWLQVQIGDYLTTHLVPEWLTEREWQSDLQALKQFFPVPEHELQRGDRWFAIKLEPLLYQIFYTDQFGSNQSGGLLLVLEEITPRKQAEAALAHQVEELQLVAQLKDDFLSTVSHELRSPMANMRMAIEMLKVAKSPEASQRYLTILQRECDRELELIEDLLDLQRLEAGAHVQNLAEIDLQSWLPDILAPFYDQTQKHQQTLQLHFSTQTASIRLDQASLERILVELVHNACKYTPPDQLITVEVNVNRDVAVNELASLPAVQKTTTSPVTLPFLQIRVTNFGTEIAETDLERVFEKFYRVPKADPWKRGGTGLGLALVKKLVDSMNGTIHVSSHEGQTSFTVEIPLSDQK